MTALSNLVPQAAASKARAAQAERKAAQEDRQGRVPSKRQLSGVAVGQAKAPPAQPSSSVQPNPTIPEELSSNFSSSAAGGTRDHAEPGNDSSRPSAMPVEKVPLSSRSGAQGQAMSV